MAQPFTAKLDTWDFSTYLRVADDVEPTSIFEEPAFSDGPLAEGQPLISLDAKNREMAWPLFLNDASKDLLHTLVQTANKACQSAAGRTIEWKDAGASNSTFFDVTYARFEPAFSYRRGVQGWLAGTLRVYCAPPYGHTGTYAAPAGGSGLGTGVALTLPLAPAGDAGALLNVQIGLGSSVTDREEGRLVGFSLVPSGRPVVYPAASLPLLAPNATITADYAAAGSLMMKRPYTGAQPGADDYYTRVDLSPASLFTGGQRIIALARGGGGNDLLTAFDNDGNQLGPAAKATAFFGFTALDLGVLRVNPVSGQATVSAFIYGADNMSLDRFLVLPEDSTSYILDTDRPLLTLDTSWDPTPGVAPTPDEVGIAYASTPDGPLLVVQNGLAQPSAAMGSLNYSVAALQHTPARDIRVETKTSGIISVAASCGVFAGKYFGYGLAAAFGAAFAQLTRSNASQLALSLRYSIGSGSLGQATVIATSVINDSGTSQYTVEWWSAGPQARGRVINAVGSVVASVGASANAFRGPGVAYIGGVASGANLNIVFQRTIALPSAPIAARDTYALGAAEDVHSNSAGLFGRSLEPFRRSNQPAASGGAALQLVAFNVPIGAAVTNDAISANVRVRERFRYAR